MVVKILTSDFRRGSSVADKKAGTKRNKASQTVDLKRGCNRAIGLLGTRTRDLMFSPNN
jgi:hypothetical protein